MCTLEFTLFSYVACVCRYGIAVGGKHVEPGFPYISDTGTYPPESCVFGQLMNLGALLGEQINLTSLGP